MAGGPSAGRAGPTSRAGASPPATSGDTRGTGRLWWNLRTQTKPASCRNGFGVLIRSAAARQPPPRGRDEVLHPCAQAGPTPDVLEHDEHPVRAQDAAGLGESGSGVHHGAEHERADERVHASVRGRQVLGRGTADLGARGAGYRPLEAPRNGLRRFADGEVDARPVVGDVRPGAGTDLDEGSMRDASPRRARTVRGLRRPHSPTPGDPPRRDRLPRGRQPHRLHRGRPRPAPLRRRARRPYDRGVVRDVR
jgi:hypothetical protein